MSGELAGADAVAAFRRKLEAILEHYHDDPAKWAYELNVASASPASPDDERFAVRFTELNFIVHAPDPDTLLERCANVLAHRAEHGEHDFSVNPEAHVAKPGDHVIGSRFVTDPRVPDELKEAAAAEAAPAEPPVERLDEAQYGAVRGHLFKITQAIGVLELDVLGRLIATAEHSLETSAAGLVALTAATGAPMTLDQAEESRRALTLELELFRAYLSFRRRVERIQAEAQGSMTAPSVLRPSTPAGAANGRKRPPRPPRKRKA